MVLSGRSLMGADAAIWCAGLLGRSEVPLRGCRLAISVWYGAISRAEIVIKVMTCPIRTFCPAMCLIPSRHAAVRRTILCKTRVTSSYRRKVMICGRKTRS